MRGRARAAVPTGVIRDGASLTAGVGPLVAAGADTVGNEAGDRGCAVVAVERVGADAGAARVRSTIA